MEGKSNLLKSSRFVAILALLLLVVSSVAIAQTGANGGEPAVAPGLSAKAAAEGQVNVIVGLALYGVIRYAWSRPSPESWVWLVVIVFLAIENITESFVLWFSYNWVLLMAAALRSGMSITQLVPAQGDRHHPGGAGARRPAGVGVRGA